MSAVTAPPGWYPINASQIGYWDGTTWTWLPPPPVEMSVLGEPRRDRPGLVSFAACLTGIGIAVGLGLLVAQGLDTTDVPDWALLLAGFATVWMGLSWGVLVALWRNDRSLTDSLDAPTTRRGWWRAIGIGVAAGLALRVGAGALAAPFVPFLDEVSSPFGQVRGGTYFDSPESALLLTFAFGAIVGAPILEELFFRNVLMPTAVRRWTLPVGVAVQAAVFALAHVSVDASAVQNLMTVTVIAGVGVGLGLLRHWTDTIVTCIVAHATFNAVAVALLVALPHLEGGGFY